MNPSSKLYCKLFSLLFFSLTILYSCSNYAKLDGDPQSIVDSVLLAIEKSDYERIFYYCKAGKTKWTPLGYRTSKVTYASNVEDIMKVSGKSLLRTTGLESKRVSDNSASFNYYTEQNPYILQIELSNYQNDGKWYIYHIRYWIKK